MTDLKQKNDKFKKNLKSKELEEFGNKDQLLKKRKINDDKHTETDVGRKGSGDVCACVVGMGKRERKREREEMTR